MEFGEYAKYAIVSLSALILFFFGITLPFLKGFELIPIFILFLLTAALCFNNKTPIGGLFYGIFTSTSFLLGNLLMAVFIEINLILSNSIMEQRSLALLLGVISGVLPEMISFIAAFACLGLFFGLLGYIYNLSSPNTIISQPRHYRDYWSSIHSLGKSEKREYNDLDRRFGGFSLTKREWWKKVVTAITLPPEELVFITRKKGDKKAEYVQGDLYDLSSGKIIGNGLVSPLDLASKYKPFVLKMPEYSTNPKGVRRIFFETLLSDVLEKFVASKLVLGLFIFISILLTYLVYLGQSSSPAFSLNPYLPVGMAVAFSTFTMFFVLKWQKKTRELFEKRPDERLFILIVYVVMALLFWFFYSIILISPADTAGWTAEWFVWIEWFVLLSIILGLSYIFIHREVEVINTYFYPNQTEVNGLKKSSPYKDTSDEPFWIKEDNVKNYWVIRFMYYWRYELAKVPHSDWERVELWLNAENGELKWVVSDYHYRELWYQAKGKLSSLYVSFFANFHTPMPILDSEEGMAISSLLNQQGRKLLKPLFTGKSQEIVDQISKILDKEFWQGLHPSKWISEFGLQNVAADFSSKLPWKFWRYPKGLEEPEIYLNQPANMPEEQPK